MLKRCYHRHSRKTARNTRVIRVQFIDDIHNLHGMAFMNGEFAVQMNNTNPFGRNEADITIGNTIKRDCKTKGGFGKSARKFGNLKMSSQCFTEKFLQEDA